MAEQDFNSVKPVLIYEGAMSTTVKRVKWLSLSSCILTIFGAPALIFTNENLDPVGMSETTAKVLKFLYICTYIYAYIGFVL